MYLKNSQKVEVLGFPLRLRRIGNPQEGGAQENPTPATPVCILLFPTLAQASLASSVNKKSNTFVLDFLVGMTGFEPATTRPPAEYATRLRHIPNIAEAMQIPKNK